MRLRTCEIDVAILQSLAVVNGDGDEPAGLGLALVAGPLKDADGAQVGRIFGFLGHLAGILRRRQPRRQTGALRQAMFVL